MLEQLKKYWAKVGEHPFLKHLFIIVCVLLVLGVATHLLLLLGTRHSAHRTVPDLTGIPLEEALGEPAVRGWKSSSTTRCMCLPTTGAWCWTNSRKRASG